MKKIITTFLLFVLPQLGCKSTQLSKENYSDVIKNMDELKKLQQDNFEKLSFSVSKKQFQIAKHPKILLEDQLGRKWLFKIGNVSSIGSATVYDFFLAFGHRSPAIFSKTLIINGKKTPGTLQRFLNTKGTLENRSFFELNQDNIDYLARTHLLSWLTLNHHVHPRQFIFVVEEPTDEPQIMRVDNAVEWYLIQSDSLELQYESPILWQVRQAGYGGYWRSVIVKNDINYTELLSLAEYINKMPDDLYIRLFKNLLDHNMLYSSDKPLEENKALFPEIDYDLSPDEFKKLLLERKNKILKDYKAFLGNIRKLAEKHYIANRIKSTDLEKEKQRILVHLQTLKQEELALSEQLKENKSEQGELNLNFSFDAFQILSEFLCQEIVCPEWDPNKLLTRLDELSKSTQNKFELKAIQNVHDFIVKNKNINRSDYLKINKLQFNANKVFDLKNP
ncbi:MAG: hypothetical protein H6625_10510 [Bdellovibrionaceae bacterium]|nr:hypothetical protein [Pseudobdellovibrionaceae bacterium]